MATTSLQDAIIANAASRSDILFPALQGKFLVRQPAIRARFDLERKNKMMLASPQDQPDHDDVLVRLPSLDASKWRVTVLQRWTGEIQRIEGKRFFAVLRDATNSRNPAELVELDVNEISQSDRLLLVEGATFYWSIGYRDTPGGQRERISTLRLARQPRLSKPDVSRIFEQADRLASLLESA